MKNDEGTFSTIGHLWQRTSIALRGNWTLSEWTTVNWRSILDERKWYCRLTPHWRQISSKYWKVITRDAVSSSIKIELRWGNPVTTAFWGNINLVAYSLFSEWRLEAFESSTEISFGMMIARGQTRYSSGILLSWSFMIWRKIDSFCVLWTNWKYEFRHQIKITETVKLELFAKCGCWMRFPPSKFCSWKQKLCSRDFRPCNLVLLGGLKCLYLCSHRSRFISWWKTTRFAQCPHGFYGIAGKAASW